MDASEYNLIDENKEYERKYGFVTNVEYAVSEKGLNEELVKRISNIKNEPDWMLEKRLMGYKIFMAKPMPKWGPDLSGINFNEIYFYRAPNVAKSNSWDQVPQEIKETFNKLQIPEAEQKFFAGVVSQFDSNVVYAHVKKQLEELGVVFTDMDSAVKEYPEIVRKYFGTVIPPTDNKFAALNTAVWSGGSFIYVPKGVKVPLALNAYFRINSESFGQFERTLIVADEGSEVTYEEGCTAPIYSTSSLHTAVVEIVALKNAHVRYLTVQNWAKNIYNLVTQRAHAYANARVEWLDMNMGSKVNMKYPSVFLKEEGASGEIISVALAGNGQILDSGGKVYHLAPNTSSRIVSKSVSKGTGITTFRGLVYIAENAANAKSSTSCDALLLDDNTKTNTYPYLDARRNDAMVSHEAKVGRINEKALFYLMSRGLSETDATTLIILGFIKDIADLLPMDYALELKRLIKLDLANAIA
ncbi:MAG: Fe-S cluster assembly protein SufB [Candidatus Micrarchaeia archaeon]